MTTRHDPRLASADGAGPVFRANTELALHVADPDGAAAFYARVLGASVGERTADCIEVATGALRLFLLRDPAPTHDRVVPSFDVSDRGAALASLQAAGCTLVPIGPHAPDAMYVRDPFGVVFDVVERASSLQPASQSRAGTALVAGTPQAAEPPGLGGLLMVIGGAICVIAGGLIVLGTQATIEVGPTAASFFVRVAPLIAGGGLVAVGAAVKRAVRRAYVLGAGDAERRLASGWPVPMIRGRNEQSRNENLVR